MRPHPFRRSSLAPSYPFRQASTGSVRGTPHRRLLLPPPLLLKLVAGCRRPPHARTHARATAWRNIFIKTDNWAASSQAGVAPARQAVLTYGQQCRWNERGICRPAD